MASVSHSDSNKVQSTFEAASPKLIPLNYLEQGLQANCIRDRRIRILLDEVSQAHARRTFGILH